MITTRSLAVLAFLGTFAVAGAGVGVRSAAAQAPDLTGTWTGEATCNGFDGTKFKVTCCPTLEISHASPTELHVRLPQDDDTVLETFLYFGRIVPDADKPAEKGEVVLVGCDTTNTLPEDSQMGRGSVKIGNKSTLKGQSFFFETVTGIQTCKWSYKRTDTADPGVPACP